MANDSSTGGALAPENGTPTLVEDDAFTAILQALVVGVVGLAAGYVRPRWSIVPSPEPEVGTNWCAIGATDAESSGLAFVTHDGAADGGAGASYVQINDEARVLASFYGPNARANASALRIGLMVPQNREALTRLHMGLVGMPSAPRYLPAIVNLQTQRRADVEFAIRRADVIQVPVRNLAAVRFTLATQAGVGTKTNTKIFTLP